MRHDTGYKNLCAGVRAVFLVYSYFYIGACVSFTETLKAGGGGFELKEQIRSYNNRCA